MPNSVQSFTPDNLQSDTENVAQLSALARWLGQSLGRELIQVERGGRPEKIKELYDAVYLPRLAALGRQAKRYIVSDDWHILCQPLHADLADTQIHIVVEMLDLIVMALNLPNQ